METLLNCQLEINVVLGLLVIGYVLYNFVRDRLARKIAVRELSRTLKEDPDRWNSYIPDLYDIVQSGNISELEHSKIVLTLYALAASLPKHAMLQTRKLLGADSKKQSDAFIDEILERVRNSYAWEIFDERSEET